ARCRDRAAAFAARSGPPAGSPAPPRWHAHWRSRSGSGALFRSSLLPRDDHLFLDDKALDAADEEGTVSVQPLGLGRCIGALHCGPVVVPEFGDAVDATSVEGMSGRVRSSTMCDCT